MKRTGTDGLPILDETKSITRNTSNDLKLHVNGEESKNLYPYNGVTLPIILLDK
jgi:hypothetical protein